MYPVLFHLGSFVVHTYGVVLMVAFLAALGRAYTVAKRQNDPSLNPDAVLDVGIWMIVVGVIGARLLFVVIDWKSYSHAPGFPLSVFKVWEGGLSFHGGLFGGLAALILAALAEGATNREIAASLFMAEKTASVHVSRILAKLGVRSRTEAAAVAHRLSLV